MVIQLGHQTNLIIERWSSYLDRYRATSNAGCQRVTPGRCGSVDDDEVLGRCDIGGGFNVTHERRSQMLWSSHEKKQNCHYFSQTHNDMSYWTYSNLIANYDDSRFHVRGAISVQEIWRKVSQCSHHSILQAKLNFQFSILTVIGPWVIGPTHR